MDEVRRIKEIAASVKMELRSEGVIYREDVELGVMIETPAAVMTAASWQKKWTSSVLGPMI